MITSGEIPESYYVGQEIDWQAPWVEVYLWVELPFWLMVGNTPVAVGVEEHNFEVAVHDNYSELHIVGLSDSKGSVIYRGPFKKKEDLPRGVRDFLQTRVDLPALWRKCKTVLKIKSRCNEDVLATANEHDQTKREADEFKRKMNGIRLYLSELCKAHIPVVNKLIQGYRLATYDYFPFEVSPWDVPHWQIEHNGNSINFCLTPYKDWDQKPRIFTDKDLMRKLMSGQQIDPATIPYKLIDESELRNAVSYVAAPGEFELLDALNFMERGDYSGAIRRITTALEVVVEAVVGKAVEIAKCEREAAKFLKATETNFRRRVERYEQETGRVLPEALRKEMYATRKLRHRIVHGGYRIDPSERGRAQKAVDIGRWAYNWFEDDHARYQVREKKIAFRSLGRDIMTGVFPTKITQDGVSVSMYPH